VTFLAVSGHRTFQVDVVSAGYFREGHAPRLAIASAVHPRVFTRPQISSSFSGLFPQSKNRFPLPPIVSLPPYLRANKAHQRHCRHMSAGSSQIFDVRSDCRHNFDQGVGKNARQRSLLGVRLRNAADLKPLLNHCVGDMPKQVCFCLVGFVIEQK
jgi:hypothetical protein